MDRNVDAVVSFGHADENKPWEEGRTILSWIMLWSRVSYSLWAALLPLYCHVREKETILFELLYLEGPFFESSLA